MSLRSTTLGHGLAALAFAALIAGCPTGADPDATGDGGALDDGGSPDVASGPGVGSTPDAANSDGAQPLPACGRLTTPCTDGEKCAGAPDCASKTCVGGLCKAAAPADGTKNGDGTDVDCGGSKAPACVDGKACLMKTDCASGVCQAKLCQVPTSSDGVQNGDETGSDCGGTTTAAPKCVAGQGCASNADCSNIKCDAVQKKCLPASHADGIKNLDEQPASTAVERPPASRDARRGRAARRRATARTSPVTWTRSSAVRRRRRTA